MSTAANDATPDFLAAVRLALVSGVGPKLRRALLDRFGDAEAVLAAAPSELRTVMGVGPKLVERISQARQTIDVEEELNVCREHGIEVLIEASPGYPALLREIHDPPAVLFIRGSLLPRDGLAIGIVGTRHATSYGLAQAERLAAGLTRAGYTVISGLARGIDGAAHRGALAAGGRTLAVTAGGLLRLYPPEHAQLAGEIAQQGAVLSESPPRFQPLAGSFPQRNRLISGLSLGVLVVEAATRSGALITARHAMEQGREVFAVPGPVDSRTSHGCHALIRDGAKLVESVDDILEELGPLATPTPAADGQILRHPAELELNSQEQAVLRAIDTAPTSIDAVVRASGLAAHQVLATLSVLEMRRLVRRQGGGQVVRL